MSVRSASIVATEILGTWAGQVFSDPHFGTEQRVLDAPVLICLAEAIRTHLPEPQLSACDERLIPSRHERGALNGRVAEPSTR